MTNNRVMALNVYAEMRDVQPPRMKKMIKVMVERAGCSEATAKKWLQQAVLHDVLD